jgi:hypothetical protein
MPSREKQMSKDTFEGLNKKQTEVLGLIAVGQDGGHHPRTLEVLIKRGFIVEEKQRLGGRFSVTISRYSLPFDVHYRWCQWCGKGMEKPKPAPDPGPSKKELERAGQESFFSKWEEIIKSLDL